MCRPMRLEVKVSRPSGEETVAVMPSWVMVKFSARTTASGLKPKLMVCMGNSSNPTQVVFSPAPTEAARMMAANGEIAAPIPTPAEDKNIHYITSPMVGTFYRAPSPTSPPFVDIGDAVKKGQTLCIVEAMKLMNEIESDVSGVVVDILVENGKPVEYGQKLFAIKVSA